MKLPATERNRPWPPGPAAAHPSPQGGVPRSQAKSRNRSHAEPNEPPPPAPTACARDSPGRPAESRRRLRRAPTTADAEAALRRRVLCAADRCDDRALNRKKQPKPREETACRRPSRRPAKAAGRARPQRTQRRAGTFTKIGARGRGVGCAVPSVLTEASRGKSARRAVRR